MSHGDLMSQQEGDIADLPDGRTAVYRGGRWQVQASGQGGDAWQIQPMRTPADQRAERTEARAVENDAWNRQMQLRTAERLDQAEARQNKAEGSDYQTVFEKGRAKMDVERFEGAMTGWGTAPSLEQRGNTVISMLDRGAPTGPMADFRIGAGKAVGGALGFLPGIPTPEETRQLEQLRLIGSQGTLGDVGQLKGPLSEKELSFIQRLQVDPNATPETNRVVAETMKWTARRQAAYGAAMDRWRRELGSPSAANAEGLTFDAWWGRYAAQTLPQPGTPEAEALERWQAQNPGREAAVTTPDQSGYDRNAQPDAASGTLVSRERIYNPATGRIE